MDKKIKEVEEFVLANSYFSYCDQDENFLDFSTRQNCIDDENYGQKDVDEANRLIKLLKENFTNLEFNIDTFDEWVDLTIEVNE